MSEEGSLLESVEEGTGEYIVSTSRTSTVRQAAAPAQVMMAPLGMAVTSAATTLLLATAMYIAGMPGGPIWLGLLPLGHLVCMGLASWDIHVVTICIGFFNAPAPRESLIPGIKTKGLPARMYPD